MANQNPYYRPDETAESRLLKTRFVVSATSFEQHVLWCRYAKESPERIAPTPVKWQQIAPGWIVEVGRIGLRPCCIAMDWSELDGELVCFYHDSSGVVDHEMIDRWINDRFKGTWGGGRRAHSDAYNFHHCLQGIKETTDG